MTEEEIEELFNVCEDEYIRFERVENKRSSRPDIHAFILLNELCPKDRNMICSASHDEIWLDVELSELEGKITKDQVIELIRCGVRLDENGLCMFA